MILGDECDGQVARRATTEKTPHSYASNLCMTFCIRYVNSSFLVFFLVGLFVCLYVLILFLQIQPHSSQQVRNEGSGATRHTIYNSSSL